MQGVSEKELYPNSTVWPLLRKSLHFKAYKLSIIQHLERWTVCMPLREKVFVTIATQYYLEYHYKALFETPYA
jgi:hypothetical protein